MFPLTLMVYKMFISMSPMQDVGDFVNNPSVMEKLLIKQFLLYFYLKTLYLCLLTTYA